MSITVASLGGAVPRATGHRVPTTPGNGPGCLWYTPAPR